LATVHGQTGVCGSLKKVIGAPIGRVRTSESGTGEPSTLFALIKILLLSHSTRAQSRDPASAVFEHVASASIDSAKSVVADATRERIASARGLKPTAEFTAPLTRRNPRFGIRNPWFQDFRFQDSRFHWFPRPTVSKLWQTLNFAGVESWHPVSTFQDSNEINKTWPVVFFVSPWRRFVDVSDLHSRSSTNLTRTAGGSGFQRTLIPNIPNRISQLSLIASDHPTPAKRGVTPSTRAISISKIPNWKSQRQWPS